MLTVAMAGASALLERKIGGVTLKSIGQIASLQRIRDNDADYVTPGDMLGELLADNKGVVEAMREAHKDRGGVTALIRLPRKACGTA
jgi:starvation-inducible DNA-binding protein